MPFFPLIGPLRLSMSRSFPGSNVAAKILVPIEISHLFTKYFHMDSDFWGEGKTECEGENRGHSNKETKVFLFNIASSKQKSSILRLV